MLTTICPFRWRHDIVWNKFNENKKKNRIKVSTWAGMSIWSSLPIWNSNKFLFFQKFLKQIKYTYFYRERIIWRIDVCDNLYIKWGNIIIKPLILAFPNWSLLVLMHEEFWLGFLQLSKIKKRSLSCFSVVKFWLIVHPVSLFNPSNLFKTHLPTKSKNEIKVKGLNCCQSSKKIFKL